MTRVINMERLYRVIYTTRVVIGPKIKSVYPADQLYITSKAIITRFLNTNNQLESNWR